MKKEEILRINELAKKSKSPSGLTEEEKAEQAALRRKYIDSMKQSLVGQLDNTYVIDEKGHKKKLEKKNGKTDNH